MLSSSVIISRDPALVCEPHLSQDLHNAAIPTVVGNAALATVALHRSIRWPPCQAPPPLPPPPPRSCSLHRPHKVKVGSRGGVALVGDGFIDLKSKIEGEQEIVVFILKSLNSGMHVQSLLNCGAQFNTMNKYIPLSVSFLHNQYLCPLRADFTPSLHSMPNYQPRMQIVMANVFQPSKAHNFKSSSLPQLDGIN
jgi:hypothetical protein